MGNYAEKQLAPATLESYIMRINKRIVPALGHIRLSKLQPHHLLKFYSNLEEAGTRLDTYYKPTDGLLPLLNGVTANDIGVSLKTFLRLKNGERTIFDVVAKISAYFGRDDLFVIENKEAVLSGKTIKHHHDLICSILSTAVKWNLITSNPAERLTPPKITKKPIQYYDESEVANLLALLNNESLVYKTALFLAIDTGIRLSELAGLTWADVDYSNNRLRIDKQRQYVAGYGTFTKCPKTESGTRFVTMSATVTALLKKYRTEQTENRLKMGNLWVDSGNIFVHEDGTPLHPERPYKWFMDFIKRKNLPKITFHALRHTNASLMIAQGVDVVTMSGRLGHADKNVTLNTYSHVISSKEKQAANQMDDFYAKYLN